MILHKKGALAGEPFADLNYPLIETETDWVLTGFSHPNYLAEFGAHGQSEFYATSSLDLAMKDAFRKVCRFIMNIKGLSEDEAIAVMSAAVDFSVTQQVVMARIYLTRFSEDFAAMKMNETYRRYFAADWLPARTCVGVTGLAYDVLIEIDLVCRRESVP
ncbi:RidA family protein [Bradyrhizobium sp. ARR65]|uniref:RidA family protein n=1 Tax=Bradyrhizobium sp. ARR65 TaxID=1040989 RepID=UPI000465AC18|nr:RidA family protein [Bradyrhizobium sp. ARR65]